MNEKKSFYETIEEIVDKDKRYKPEAYEFVMEALNYTQKIFKKLKHVSGKELLKGIRDYGLEKFGYMTKMVFNDWGVKRTEDFGNIVFNMVNTDLLSKTDKDQLEDFKNVYNFNEAFDYSKIKKKKVKKRTS